jgi:hypothetical protein
MATPQGTGAGQGQPAAAAAPEAPRNFQIPAERLAYMRNTARVTGFTDKITEDELNQILENSYRNDPTLRGMLLQANLDTRARVIIDTKNFDNFMDQLAGLVGNAMIQRLRDYYSALEIKTDSEGMYDFRHLKEILHKLKTNQTIYAAELRDSFMDTGLGGLERILLTIYDRKKSSGTVFSGGKRRSSTHSRKRRSRTRKSTKRK